ncbi:MAG: carboxypeptidase-like regulatory domain-containing protein [Cyclobacteriaceae bacterium]
MTRKGRIGFLSALLFALVLSVCGQVKDTISVNFKDVPLEFVFDSISIKSNYDFSYNAESIPPGSLYSYRRSNVAISDLLNILFVGTDLEYVKLENQIIVRRQKEPVIVEEEGQIRKISIAGWVRESDSKQPIVGANVYIQGSTIGTTTDKNGNYRLNNVVPGNYVIVFSHIGYVTGSYNLKADISDRFSVNSLMEPRVETLQDVEIVSDPLVRKEAERSRHFNTFKKELLGTSQNASRCEIENPEVLDYTYSQPRDFLHVIANEPIVVTNNALGYRIIMDLDYFNKQENRINFHGQARYEAIEPKSRKQKRRWRRNRKAAYNGSMIHFFKALVNDNLDREGFRIGSTQSIDDTQDVGIDPINPEDLITPVDDSNEWLLAFDDYLYVEYQKEVASHIYLNEIKNSANEDPEIKAFREIGTGPAAPQRSLIQLRTGEIYVGKDGTIDDRLSIVSLGYWSWERLADLMPINYDPKKDKF